MAAKASVITEQFKKAKQRRQKVPLDIKGGSVVKSNESDISVKRISPPSIALSEEDKLETLREFDLNYKYGPSHDITRIERWNRANNLKKNPPQQIKDIILSDQKYLGPLWEQYNNLIPIN
ncbi:DNA polymerase delta subunit 4-like [Clavelina lepadiformis]|uniref:DNA polymerase delta subunit 4-like n=1 Tax=Clavelina lepadiformis TaxID=159417 RepID=UPI0040436A52